MEDVMKESIHIKKWGKIKPFFDKNYRFNTLDLETVDNDLFLLGVTLDGRHETYQSDFYNHFHDFLITCIQTRKDVLTWSRYDNTHLLKLILSPVTSKKDINLILSRVGKVSPIYRYTYGDFTFLLENIIKDSMIFKMIDKFDNQRNITLYNLKNLYDTNLETTAKNYAITYYSKMSDEYHIIDKKRFKTDISYHHGVIESNRLDNLVLLDIAKGMLESFKMISGRIPKSIFTNGSLARSYLLANIGEIGSKNLSFINQFKGKLKKLLLDYSMKSYHGGKIESYVLGYIPKAKIIDITSAYPYAMSQLPKLTNKIVHDTLPKRLDRYFYAFIQCEIHIKDASLIHPIIVENPINKSNISPFGYMKTIITKIEYDYLMKKGVEVKVIDYLAIEHEESYPYKNMVDLLFSNRIKTKTTNPSLSMMYKTILNSLYGITYELTDMYIENEKGIEWLGYRAGDYFNSVIASYITAMTRTYLSEVSHDIILHGGQVFLNMTDSIIYDGHTDLDIFSHDKILGKFECPKLIKDIYILGAGRYEYRNEFDSHYTIKNRGFSVSVKDKSFYSDFNLNGEFNINHQTFVTSFKATTKKYNYEKMGYLIDDTYTINPFNLGGKRIVENRDIDLNKNYTRTKSVYLERDII